MPQPSESWKRFSPRERRAQLMSIAEDLFQTRPYGEIGVADVARAAGITHGLIYHYFTSKEALFIAVCEERAKELLESSMPDPSLPLPEQAVQGISGYLDFVEAHRVSYLNLFRGPNANQGEFFRICEETRFEIMERLLDAMGLAALPLPATRVSLRGYLGFAESVVLEWLEAGAQPRLGDSRESRQEKITIGTSDDEPGKITGEAGAARPPLAGAAAAPRSIRKAASASGSTAGDRALQRMPPKPVVPRAALEHMIRATLGAALRAGLEVDLAPLPDEVRAMLDRYEAHLSAKR